MSDQTTLVKRIRDEAFRFVDGSLHVDIRKILEIMHWPDTPTTRNAVAKLSEFAVREIYGDVTVVQLDEARNN